MELSSDTAWGPNFRVADDGARSGCRAVRIKIGLFAAKRQVGYFFRTGTRAEVRRRGFTGLEMCLSVLRRLLDVIDNVNFHDALLRFHSQTQRLEYLKHRGPVGDGG